MATYYINGYNTNSGGFPYTRNGLDGAPNMHTLLTECSSILRDGDTIEVYDGDFIDDTSNALFIKHNIEITTRGGKDIPVHLKNDGVGLYTLIGCKISNTKFYKANPSDNMMICVESNDVDIDTCEFSYGSSEGTNGSPIIYVVDTDSGGGSDGLTVNNCSFVYPQDGYGYAVYLESDNDNCTITNNFMDINGGGGYGVSMVSGHNTNISYNVIDNYGDTKYGQGIYCNGDIDNLNLTHNAINIDGVGVVGITTGVSVNFGRNINITHNVVILNATDSDSTAIYIPSTDDNAVSSFTVVDNILYGGGGDAVALNISTQRTIIDYNNIYGFVDGKLFVNTGAPDIIQQLGRRTIFTEPKLTMYEDVDLYPDASDIRRFYCYTTSECIGSGYSHHSIGIGVYDNRNNDNYTNIVDTVTENLGLVDNTDTTTMTFFNNALTETHEEYNAWYRNGSGPYMSGNVYKNQWEYERVVPTTFPFEVGDKFYNQSFIYILQHKDDLKPFEDIKCPANPGYGYREYEGYETGLWGFPRVDYKNGCFPEPCIIQDSYIEETQINDTINDVEFWIWDAINPPCADDGSQGEVLVILTLASGRPFTITDTAGDGKVTNVMIQDQLTAGGYTSTATETATSVEFTHALKSIDEFALSNSSYFSGSNWVFSIIDMAGGLIIPRSVVSIGRGAFFGWLDMSNITFEGLTPPSTNYGDYGLATACEEWSATQPTPGQILSEIYVTVPDDANLTEWKNALENNNTELNKTKILSINSTPWEDIPII